MSNEIIDKQLFWEKYRASDLSELILPKRIKNLVKDGINNNYLFFGSPGCGKSSLCRILLQEYPNSHITLSSKLGVEELRGRVDKFCKEMIPFEDPNKLRIVYFEEFDRASKQLQEELKSFIEDHSKRVRFLATCNNIQKLDSGVRSRFVEVDFSTSAEEAREIKISFCELTQKRLVDENITIDKPVLAKIINQRFPDFRKVWQDIQYTYLSKSSDITILESETDEDKIKLFRIVLNKKDNISNWDYLANNWMDKIEYAFQCLGRDFFNYVKTSVPERENKLGNHLIILSEYSDNKLPNSLDPFITLTALVCKLQELYN